MFHDWARAEGLILPVEIGPVRQGGAEHDVAHQPETGRWLKFTKPNRAGYVVEQVNTRLEMFPASPLQYLQRWQLAARIFADDVELKGLVVNGNEMRIVVSQRDLVGEAPTWDELHQAMTNVYELREMIPKAVLGGYEARTYYRGRFAVFDVRPANCVRTSAGDVVPFDIIPQIFGSAEAGALQNRR